MTTTKSHLSAKTIPERFPANFLHTLSHLLIKQLSFECGYGIASLKERIYCSEASDGKEMSGVLIYTACGDSEGTLGGLVRQGRSDTFPRIFNKAIENARTCSNDPVCSLSQGQGRDSLNLAACYSRALIPETSCEEFNCFLDRGVVVGTFDNPNLGFFHGAYESVSIPQNTLVVSDSHQTSLMYKGDGTDMCDSTYREIWSSLLNWSTDETESELLRNLIEKAALLVNEEKPVMNGTMLNLATQEAYTCDLIWKQAKIIFLTEENEDIVPIIQNSGWTCFYSTTPGLTADEIIRTISEV